MFRTQLQNVQVETNRLRYTVQQKDDDIRHVLQDLKDQRLANDRLSLQIKSKEDEIDRLRKQLLDTPNVVMAASPPPAPQNTQEVLINIIIIFVNNRVQILPSDRENSL